MPELIIRSGKLSGRKLVLPDTEIVIGRDDDCKIRLTSADISRRHCRILPTNKGLIVRDLGSRNGTFVNEDPVVEAVLMKAGDLLRVGPMTFEVPSAEETSNAEEANSSTISTPTDSEKTPPTTPPRKKKRHIALPSREKIGMGSSTDEDIASWLSAGEEEEVSTGDTTIIPRTSPLLKDKKSDDEGKAERSVNESIAEPPSPKQSIPKTSVPSRSDSLADEAAEIIRKHWESVK